MAKTPEELAENLVKIEEKKGKFSQNSQELDGNLKRFHEILDPIFDPTTGQPLCWVRRPSGKDWETISPPELSRYTDLATVSKELSEKYKDHQYEVMAKLIEKPKHDAKWWKGHTNLIFQEMFMLHLMDLYRKLGMMVQEAMKQAQSRGE